MPKTRSTKKKAAKKGVVKKKRTKTKRNLPAVVSLVACEAISADPTSNKITLYGVIKEIKLQDINDQVERICIYVKLDGGEGKYGISFCIKLPNADASPTGETQIQFGEHLIIDGNAAIESVSFPKPGIYHVCVLADGEVIGNPYPLLVRVINKGIKE